MAAKLYRAISQAKALTFLLEKITSEIVETPNPIVGDDPISRITSLDIGWYSEFLKGTNVTYLENPSEDPDITRLLPVMSSSDYVYYALECIGNNRTRVNTGDANTLVNVKGPDFVTYLKCRIPMTLP